MVNFSACHRTVTFGKDEETIVWRPVRGKGGKKSGAHNDGIYAENGQGWPKAEVPQATVKTTNFSANA